MRFLTAITLVCAGTILGSIAGQAVASEPGRAFMVTTGPTAQPIGHYEFCRRHGGECAVRGGDARVRLTPALWNELVGVNASVNLTTEAATDDEVYGRAEHWAYPDGGAGDCEDLVLQKRRMLIGKGWPVGALLITVVRQTNGDGHAVLTVLTDRGDLILDNLQPRVLVWRETDYAFVKRQSEVNSGQWKAIDDARMTMVGSTQAN